jgi:alkanesulfonate monooxygenase SsuD/methylene tetrahydromethanopterin reductase-like flavin-dependent oxidoreductase (luciferase family)
MTLESLDIMLRLWRGEPFDFDGAFWRVRKPASSLDVDYLIERSWLVGSPDTVTRRLADLTRTTGGFGALLVMIYDFSSEPDWWNESLRLLTTEVMPHFS